MDKMVFERISNAKDTPFFLKKCFDPKIFTKDDANRVFNNPVLLPEVTLAGIDKGAIPLNTFSYGWGEVFDRDQIFFGLKNGFTLAVNRINSYNFQIQKICCELEQIFNGSADAHMYISLTDYSTSFGIHRDQPYNLILQTEGECTWNIWGNVQEITPDAPTLTSTLTPGDIAYIPSGVFHQCVPIGKRLSVSIPVKPHVRAEPRHIYDLFKLSREAL